MAFNFNNSKIYRGIYCVCVDWMIANKSMWISCKKINKGVRIFNGNKFNVIGTCRIGNINLGMTFMWITFMK